MPVRGNKIERSDDIKTVEHLMPLEFYVAIGVVDGNGIKRNRVVFRAKGTKNFFFAFPEGTEEAMKGPAPWLQELLEKEIGDHAADLPVEKASDIPVGSPL